MPRENATVAKAGATTPDPLSPSARPIIMRAEQVRAIEIVPVRLRRSRAKGARLVSPNGLPVVCVTRPGPLGNPFTADGCRAAGYRGTDAEIAKQCVGAFSVWLGPHWRENWDGEEAERRRAVVLRRLPELRGKNLACYCRICPAHAVTGKPLGVECPDCAPCHADVLLAMANTPLPRDAAETSGK